MTTANYRDSNGNWKAWSPDMVGVAANANTLGGGTHVPKAAYGIVDYNNTGQTVTIGYAGNGFTSSDFTYALGLNTSRQIKDVSKNEYQKWLGLGSLAYKSSLSYSDVGAAASSHTHSQIQNGVYGAKIDSGGYVLPIGNTWIGKSDNAWDTAYITNVHGTSDVSLGVKDYNGSGTIKIGYAGDSLNTSNLINIAGYTNNGTQIKDVSKSVLQSWLGLGSAAYTASASYASSGHTHTSLTDVDASSRQISISYAGDTATSINHLCCFVDNGTKIKDANETAVKTLLGLNNVNNTADSNKSVKYATSSGSADYASKANILKYTHTNEVNFSGGMQSTCYFNYRNADSDTCDGGTTDITYKFCNYNNNVTNTTLDAASFTGIANYAKIVKDSSNSNNTTFAYSKAGLDYSAYTWLAGWNGYELRAVNKSQFATSGHTHSGMITTSNIGSYNAGGTDYYTANKGVTKLSSSSTETSLCSITLPAGYGWLLTATICYDNAGSNGCCLLINDANAAGYIVNTIEQAYAGYACMTYTTLALTRSAKNTFTLIGRIGGSGGGYVRTANISAVRAYKF